MSAKLARLEQQEAEFMAKYGKRSQAGSAPSQSAVEDSYLRKESKSAGDARESNDKVPDNPEIGIKIKKKKKKKHCDEETEVAPEDEGDVMCLETGNKDPSDKTKRNKNNNADKEEGSLSSPAEAPGSLETAEFTNKKKKKKKRKSPKLQCDFASEEQTEDAESNQAEPTPDRPLEGKRGKAEVLMEASDDGQQGMTVKQKRKKCKKDKARDGLDEDEPPPKKKKKKKSKE